MRALELKVPPPVVALLVALVMWGVSGFLGVGAAPDRLRVLLAMAFALVGATVDVSGLVAFRRAKTTINPMKPRSTSAIVDSGIYGVTRNPMYLGLALLLFGWAVYLGSWWLMLGPPVFGAYVGRFQIAPEERILTDLFGARYLAYKARVRRWI